MGKKVIVIGAGAAGLASAIRLQYAGYQVELYEKESTPGGKMNQVEMAGYRFDLGPTIVMMPNVYREVFEYCERNPDDYIPMEQLDPMYRVYFTNDPSKPMNVSNNLVEWTRTLESISKEDAAGFLDYLSDLYRGFHVAWDSILQRPFRKSGDFYNLSMLKKGMKMKVSRNADQFIGKYIKDKRIKQMLNFQTLYIGISPMQSPSFYTMILAIQFTHGVWFMKGGMYTMAASMEKLFKELGGKTHYHANVEEILIKDKKAIGIRVNQKESLADYVVCNADFPYAMKNLIQDQETKGKYTDKKIDQMKYSCSCFVMYLGMNRKYDEWEHVHNFVFSDQFEDNMNDIFEGNKLKKGSFYVYIASKLDPTLAPEGKDGIYIMMPVSNVSSAKYNWNDETVTDYRTYILDTLKSIKGLENLENEIVTEKHFTPVDFEETFHAYNGATFGLLPTLNQSGPMRPQSKSKTCSNLYFTGSSTHPGAGVPIVLLSAKIAAQELIQDDQGIIFDY